MLMLLSLFACDPKPPADPVEAPTEIPEIHALALNQDLVLGEPITSEMLEVAPAPHWVPEEVYLDADLLVGRVPRERLLAGEIVREERLTDPEAGRDRSATVPRGLSLVPVAVHQVGLLEPSVYCSLIGSPVPEEIGNHDILWVGAVSRDEHRVALGAFADRAHVFLDSPTRVPVVFNPIDVTHVETHGPAAVSLPDPAEGAVAVAVRDLYPGVPIGRDDVMGVADWPDSGAPTVAEVVGRVLHERILALEPIRAERLADRRAGLRARGGAGRSRRSVARPA